MSRLKKKMAGKWIIIYENEIAINLNISQNRKSG